jgi:hypothetical protein
VPASRLGKSPEPKAEPATPAGSVPKTTSGKIQRQLCRRLLREGEFELLADWRLA